jgi:hypothetical protein
VPISAAADAASPCRRWQSSDDMASEVGLHPRTLLRLRRQPFSPFEEGLHFRRGGLSTGAPLPWEPVATEAAFTSFCRIDSAQVETFSRGDV